jgi:hypothetical protein
MHEHPAALQDQPEPAAQVNLARVGLDPGDLLVPTLCVGMLVLTLRVA